MSVPIGALLTWVAVLIGVAVVAVVIFAVVELIKSSRVRCVARDCLSAAWHAPRDLYRRWKERKSRSPISDFPLRPVAMLLLLAVLSTMFFLAIGPVIQGPATFGFNASFREESPAVLEPKTAAPSVGAELSVEATVNPPSEELLGVAVAIAGPTTVAFKDCYARAGEKTTKRGYAHGPRARILLAELGLADEVEVACTMSVKHRIRDLETVDLDVTAADASTAEEQFLNLLPPNEKLDQEKAEALAETEIRTSPAAWQKSSMRPAPDAFKEQGARWSLLDPKYLHGFHSGLQSLTRTLHQLEDTRVESSKIVTLEAVITSRPVTQERFRARGSNRQAIRQVYAIGQDPGEQGGWCTTTRSTAQRPLKKGDHLRIRAAVIQWGRSEESGGIAVMLNCPAVKID